MKRVLVALLLGLAVLIGLAFALSSFVVFSPQLNLFANQVAVIPVKGELVEEKPVFVSGLSGSEIIAKLEEARETPGIGAVLLDIDSGGGSVVTSKQVVAAVEKTREKKPVVAWIGNTGASGAYYVAAAADHIMADEDSLTGSIGVVSVVANIRDLLEEWGVEVKVLKGGRFKAMGSMFEGLSLEEEEILQEILESAFQHFKDDVKRLRGERLNLSRFEEIADGRVLSGEQALEAGLVDSLGTRKDAVQKAASLAGIEEPVTVELGEKATGWWQLFGNTGYVFGTGLRQGIFSESEPELRS